MAAARSSSLAAAATETRVYALSKATIKMEKIDQCSPCSVRVHGPVLISREYLKIGDVRPKVVHEEDEPPNELRVFDRRMEVKDVSLLRSYVSCRDLIHRMLAGVAATRDCDLDADNWDDFQPHEIATAIVARVRRDTQDARGVGVVPAYTIKVETALCVTLTYSEPKALLLACKEEAADGIALARGRKRRRYGELCAICFSDVKTGEEETVGLPCSHAFHRQCIAPWFHRASTCPICRRDALEFFGSVDRGFLGHVFEDENSVVSTEFSSQCIFFGSCKNYQ